MNKLVALTVSGSDDGPDLAIVYLSPHYVEQLLAAMDQAKNVEKLFGEDFYAVEIFDKSHVVFYDHDNSHLVIDDYNLWDDEALLSGEHDGNHEPTAEIVSVGDFITELRGSILRVDATMLVVMPDRLYWKATKKHSGETIETAVLDRDDLTIQLPAGHGGPDLSPLIDALTKVKDSCRKEQ